MCIRDRLMVVSAACLGIVIDVLHGTGGAMTIVLLLASLATVSYTHLTLPTIYSV